MRRKDVHYEAEVRQCRACHNIYAGNTLCPNCGSAEHEVLVRARGRTPTRPSSWR
ncbi:hypothetical protein IG193_07785 [Infirmifilum lucidum]|uniref:Uncharacterized protein n=1 Tax=Infirmifilum lucidum TaxID=2776706 RepID=A0A7L9FI97_9CREN|nr:hypothetical protein [Infirmifilum lucidum]QOJ78646.1 hypothetical protein IG193_07785 [Infirmifilum lucidum]